MPSKPRIATLVVRDLFRARMRRAIDLDNEPMLSNAPSAFQRIVCMMAE